MKYVRQQIKSWVYSNIDQDYNDWNPATTYIYEDIATPTNNSVATYKSYYWRSLIDSNIGNNPEEAENVKWNRWKVANVNAMLDQKSLSKTEVNFEEADADYLSTDIATDIATDSLVWDVVNEKIYKAMVGTNDLPNSDFSDETLWENKSDIIVEFERNLYDSMGLGYLEASQVIIQHYDELGVLLPEYTQTFNFGVNENVFDYYDYIYESYSDQIDRTIFVELPPIGDKIRATIVRNKFSFTAGCGFLVAGEAVDMGDTLDEVAFNFNSFSAATFDLFGNLNVVRRNVQDLVDFETIIDKTAVPQARRNIKGIYDEVVLFVVDPSESSFMENALTLGKIQDASVIGRVATKNIISWSIFESI